MTYSLEHLQSLHVEKFVFHDLKRILFCFCKVLNLELVVRYIRGDEVNWVVFDLVGENDGAVVVKIVFGVVRNGGESFVDCYVGVYFFLCFHLIQHIRFISPKFNFQI